MVDFGQLINSIYSNLLWGSIMIIDNIGVQEVTGRMTSIWLQQSWEPCRSNDAFHATILFNPVLLYTSFQQLRAVPWIMLRHGNQFKNDFQNLPMLLKNFLWGKYTYITLLPLQWR